MRKKYKLVFLSVAIIVMLSVLLQIISKNEQQKFIYSVAKEAEKDYQKGGVLPSITIAQAILESNWGKSELAEKAHNLFGIKGAYEGKSISMITSEYKNKKNAHNEKAIFRSYPSIYESIQDHTHLFQKGTSWNKQQYKQVLIAKDAPQAANALQQAAYSTDPSYANKLLKLINQYHLNDYDQRRT